MFEYPRARKGDVVDDYHGTPVADPYRWLEDPHSDETLAWVDAQNALTASYLEEIPARNTIHSQLNQVWDFSRVSPPMKRGGHYFYFKNDGLQNQPTLVSQPTLAGESREILDINALSDDGTTALVNLAFTKNADKFVYALSEGGSDWQTLHICDTQSGQSYDEVLNWSKFSSLAWAPDGSGFYYSRYPEPEPGSDSAQNTYNNAVYFHTLGQPQSADMLIYERPAAAPNSVFGPK